MKVLYAGYRDSRHSKFGGYDYIVNNPGAEYLDAAKLPFGFIPVGKRGKKLNLIVLDLIARLKSKKFDVVHYFYSDFMLFNKICDKATTKFVATVHMKSEDFSEKKINILKTYKAVIVLSSSEEKNLRKLGVNAYFVPHGFNKPEFNYLKSNIDNSKVNIFYSGMNYRDFDTFYKVAEYIEKENVNIHFFAVGQSSERKELLKSLNNITVCPRLSDDEYYSLLTDCDYNFLPLTFATANNALLEAQNLGVISILPKMDGIEDYADSTNNYLYENWTDLINIFTHISKAKKSEKIIDYSKAFRWENIYKQLNKIYLEC